LSPPTRNYRGATLVISALTALAWLVAVVLGKTEEAALGLGFIPARLSGIPISWPALPAFLTPLSATLVHSGLIHLGFNLLILVWCGIAVERVLGKTGLIVLYVVGAYAAAIAQWAVAPSATVPMVGASGAISAVIGAFALSFGRARMITRSPRLNRWINALWLMVAWVVLQLMMGWLAGGQGYLLATPAHVGGFAAGLLLQRPLLLWRYRKA
jgi:membrane associated rhomboid family serine protease